MSTASDFLAAYSVAEHKRESRAIAAYDLWSQQFIKPNGWIVIPAGERPRGIAASVDNAMRSRVERYRIFTAPPESLVAYIGDNPPNGCGLDKEYGRTYRLTVWTGESIGYATLARSWPVNSYCGTRMYQIYAWIHGADGVEREYTGRGFGVGMSVALRETANSRRARAYRSNQS